MPIDKGVPWHRLDERTNSGANQGLISKIEQMAKRVEKDAVSDNELVGRCLQGDETAWSQLIGRYQRLVYSVAHALCSDPDDTADVFQATCLDLYKGLPLLRDIKALPAWLITVTRRRAIAVLRARIPTSNNDENLEELGQTQDVIQAMLPHPDQPDGDLIDTGIKVVVPDEKSAIQADKLPPNAKHMTLPAFKAWLDEYGLTGS